MTLLESTPPKLCADANQVLNLTVCMVKTVGISTMPYAVLTVIDANRTGPLVVRVTASADVKFPKFARLSGAMRRAQEALVSAAHIVVNAESLGN